MKRLVWLDRLRCRCFGHRWNLHAIPMHGTDIGYGEWIGVENRQCIRCGAPGPEWTYHKVWP